MKAKFGALFMFLGTVLILGAVGLFAYNQQEASTAEESAQVLLTQLVEEIREEVAENAETMPAMEIPTIYLDESDFVMEETIINGYRYIGFLSFPSTGLEVPILSDWSYDKLQIAPCRYFGTLKGGNLVLMAHNYRKHFGRISELVEGDNVIFTDVNGDTTTYEVVARDVLAPTAVEDVISGDFDLTLFTCTYGGRSRITVYCDMI